jgi:DNA-binding MarR family transcriptional regulator
MPTQKEIGIHFKISLGGATGQRMKKLIEKGYIQRTQGPRGYAIIEN